MCEELKHVFFTNLLFLEFDPVSMNHKHRIEFNKDMFDLPNKVGLYEVLFFLFNKLDPVKCANEFWGIRQSWDKKAEAHFKKVATAWITHIAKTVPSSKLPRLPSLFTSPCGHKLYNLLTALSHHVLHHQLNHLYDKRTHRDYLGLSTVATEATTKLLVVATHDICVKHVNTMQSLNESQTEWKEFAGHLTEKYRRNHDKKKKLEVELKSLQEKSFRVNEPEENEKRKTKTQQVLNSIGKLRHLEGVSNGRKEGWWREDDVVLDGGEITIEPPTSLLQTCQQDILKHQLNSLYTKHNNNENSKLDLLKFLTFCNITLKQYKQQMTKVSEQENGTMLGRLERHERRMTGCLTQSRDHNKKMQDCLIPAIETRVAEMKQKVMTMQDVQGLSYQSKELPLLPSNHTCHPHSEKSSLALSSFRLSYDQTLFQNAHLEEETQKLLQEVKDRVKTRINHPQRMASSHDTSNHSETSPIKIHHAHSILLESLDSSSDVYEGSCGVSEKITNIKMNDFTMVEDNKNIDTNDNIKLSSPNYELKKVEKHSKQKRNIEKVINKVSSSSCQGSMRESGYIKKMMGDENESDVKDDEGDVMMMLRFGGEVDLMRNSLELHKYDDCLANNEDGGGDDDIIDEENVNVTDKIDLNKDSLFNQYFKADEKSKNNIKKEVQFEACNDNICDIINLDDSDKGVSNVDDDWRIGGEDIISLGDEMSNDFLVRDSDDDKELNVSGKNDGASNKPNENVSSIMLGLNHLYIQDNNSHNSENKNKKDLSSSTTKETSVRQMTSPANTLKQTTLSTSNSIMNSKNETPNSQQKPSEMLLIDFATPEVSKRIPNKNTTIYKSTNTPMFNNVNGGIFDSTKNDNSTNRIEEDHNPGNTEEYDVNAISNTISTGILKDISNEEFKTVLPMSFEDVPPTNNKRLSRLNFCPELDLFGDDADYDNQKDKSEEVLYSKVDGITHEVINDDVFSLGVVNKYSDEGGYCSDDIANGDHVHDEDDVVKDSSFLNLDEFDDMDLMT